MRTLLVGAVLALLVATSSFGQQVSAAADPLKGVWKLNLERSNNAMAPESEVITIVSQDSSYKLTFDRKQSNGYNPKYDVVTNMKGETVKPVYADGSGTNSSWRVARLSANAFEMELKGQFGGWTDKYEVSPDGKTMTLHRTESRGNRLVGGYIEKDGSLRHESQYILVFERVEQ